MWYFQMSRLTKVHIFVAVAVIDELSTYRTTMFNSSFSTEIIRYCRFVPYHQRLSNNIKNILEKSDIQWAISDIKHWKKIIRIIKYIES